MQAQPWKKIALTDEQLQVLYREWGVFYTLKQKVDIAAQYYDKSLELGIDPKALYNRSRCKRTIARTETALRDAQAAMDSHPKSQPYNVEVCDGQYQLNQFETARSSIFNGSLKFRGLKLLAFKNRSDVLDLDFKATLGDTLGLFILSHEKDFHLARANIDKERNIDQRPLWKILREQEKCDVLSILEKEEELISPREIARRRRAFNIFNQIYMQKNWVDVLFLRALTKDPNLLLEQSEWSRPLLENITSHKYDATMRFLKMLHARSPLYNEKVRRCPNRKLNKERNQDYLFRVQYQIHRNMLAILGKIRYLRKLKHVEELAKYVEEVMGDYVVLKTYRVMPWKFEFINEVYNLMALSYIDLYIDIPRNISDYKAIERLHLLLRMPLENDKEPPTFVFGDKSTYQDEGVADKPLLLHKKYVGRLEKRILFAEYSIEKAFLWYEIAKSNLKNCRFVEAVRAAARCIDAAKKCKSYTWVLLGYLITCRTYASEEKVEKIATNLLEAYRTARLMKDSNVMSFIELLLFVNDINYQEKKIQELKKVRSRVRAADSTTSTMRSSYDSEP